MYLTKIEVVIQLRHKVHYSFSLDTRFMCELLIKYNIISPVIKISIFRKLNVAIWATAASALTQLVSAAVQLPTFADNQLSLSLPP